MNKKPPASNGWQRAKHYFSGLLCVFIWAGAAEPGLSATAELKNLTVEGALDEQKARLLIQADLKETGPGRQKPLYATVLEQSVVVSLQKATHSFRVVFDVLQGAPKEFALVMAGAGEIRRVTGEGLLDWGVRQENDGTRFLVLRPRPREGGVTNLTVQVTAEAEVGELPKEISLLSLASRDLALFHGYVRIDTDPGLDLQTLQPSGLIPISLEFMPEAMKSAADGEGQGKGKGAQAFRFHGTRYGMHLRMAVADLEARQIVLRDFDLEGVLSGERAEFTLATRAGAKNAKGGVLDFLSGEVALTQFDLESGWRLELENGKYRLRTDRAGESPVRVRFSARVAQSNGWHRLDFRVAPSVLQPVKFRGLAPATEFEFGGAARPELREGEFRSYLPADGRVQVAWKEAKREGGGKLFYGAELLSQVVVAPGLMRQIALLEGKIMQGELDRLVLRLRGGGEVTRVQGASVLAWQIEPGPSEERRLIIQLNQPQRESFAIQVQLQSPLGVFPAAAAVTRLEPEGATRFAGYIRVVNEGAVRLEILEASALSQISPEQFPEGDVTRAWFGAPSGQRFAFRFASAEYQLRVQADNIVPELGVSEVLSFHFGETELILDGEIEVDVREAPIRELLLQVPRGFSIARLNVSGLSDYFLRELEKEPEAELRLVYGKPVSGRQIIQIRLERNQPLSATNWALPRLSVVKAKSVRGQIGVSSDPGYRLTPVSTENLGEMATAFFPRKGAGLQAAFRIMDSAWAATMRVERLPQTIQANAMHLFSIGDGIAYGSSVIQYLISGAPIGVFQLALSNDFYNVEFTGKDVRNWQKTESGFVVQLHAPVSGPYTLLVTYERPFKAQGERLGFAGARPLDAQSEQGRTIIISTYQFQVTPANVSSGLAPLEPGEVPAEDRLFFDAPILAAYRYTKRPFNLELVLSRLAQGDTLNQVADRASLTTRVSKDGEILTNARYFLKNRGTPHVRLQLPERTELFSASINGANVVPVQDGQGHLIPLPQRVDPNGLQQLDLKLASRSLNPKRVRVAAPILSAPVLLAQWKVEPDVNQRLVYRSGTLTPNISATDRSGFAGLIRLLRGPRGGERGVQLLAGLALLGVAAWAWRWAQKSEFRFTVRHLAGLVLGLIAFGLAAAVLVQLADLAGRTRQPVLRELTFLAPIQQSGSELKLELANLPERISGLGYVGQVWPALLALVIWAYTVLSASVGLRPVGVVVGWVLVFWAALRLPNGAQVFFGVLTVFLVVHLLAPALRRLWRLPAKPKRGGTPPGAQAASVTAALLFLILASSGQSAVAPARGVAQSVSQEIRVEDKFAFAAMRIRWEARKDQVLPVLFEPGVLTRALYRTNALKMLPLEAEPTRTHLVQALADGPVEIELNYQVQIAQREDQSGFVLPTPYGLINQVQLTLAGLDVEVISPQAVEIKSDATGKGGTVAHLVLAPGKESWIGWKPRSRDTRREAALFYAELFQLYVPAPGVIEGAHVVQVRPAQGELRELSFRVPGSVTITDVTDSGASASTNAPAEVNARGGRPSAVSLWRFDPDTRQLRVLLSSAQAKPFGLLIRSQIAAGSLPHEQAVGLIRVENSAGEIGLLGLATGPEVQLESARGQTLTPINLEDFPGGPLQALQGQIPGLTLRRAFRYADPSATAVIGAAPVEPDVRVVTQETLSLAEDRVVLAAQLNVEITRAGIFRFSFLLPPGFDVESISGQRLSHWAELKTDAGRLITLHFPRKTEGQHQFGLSLASSGLRATNGFVVPKILVREAGKQSGQLLIVPEQGLRVQVARRESATQLDPQTAGIRQKGVLGFRLLSSQWNLVLDLEQIDPWVQVTTLQHVTITEAQLNAAVNFHYQIENTGLRSFEVQLAGGAESVTFRGENMADFLPSTNAAAGGLRTWQVKLHRRVLGRYLLQVTYQVPLQPQERQIEIIGVRASGVNLQRGFVTLQSDGRLQMSLGVVPPALQSAEWGSIPRELRQGLPETAAHYTFRLVEPAFQLPVALEHRDVTKLLPARINAIELTSVLSDNGMMLTQARLDMSPGDKRLLHFKLPKNARFWFAFVNQNSVWPWRQADQILIPLQAHSPAGQGVNVELFYSSDTGAADSRSLDLRLLGPQFDLPLENITWRLYLNEKWRVTDWTGTLQLTQETRTAATLVDLQSYLQNEMGARQEKTKEAEQWLERGNTLLKQGDPSQARQAFQNAYGLSTHDRAFNEDARVQLHNLKMQQAIVGLNVQQSAVAGQAPVKTAPADPRAPRALAYTQEEAKQIIDRVPSEDNAALTRLAERLIQQQDAAVASPLGIRAAIPTQGRVLTFTRAMQVDSWADLRIGLEAKTQQAAGLSLKFLVLLGLLVFAGAVMAAGKRNVQLA